MSDKQARTPWEQYRRSTTSNGVKQTVVINHAGVKYVWDFDLKPSGDDG